MDRVERVGVAAVDGETGEGAPRDRSAGRVAIGRHDRRVVAVVGLAVDHERRADLVVARVVLAGDDEQVAVRDREEALRGDAGRQHLDELGVGDAEQAGALEAVHEDHAGALGADEEEALPPEDAVLDGLGLVALVLAAALGVVADARDELVDGVARLVDGLPEDRPVREAAAAAVEVALVGRREQERTDPADGVRLARDVLEAGVLRDQVLLLGVDAVEVDRAGGERRQDLARLERDEDDVVVLLEGDGRDVERVDVDVLGLRVVREEGRDADEVDVTADPVGGVVADEVDDHEVAGRELRRSAVAELLVALVLDRDGGVGAVGADGGGVGLTAEVDRAHDRPGRDVDHLERTRRVDEVGARVDGDEREAAADGDGGRLAGERDDAGGLGVRRIGDVDEAGDLELAVRVDQRVAVLGGGDDLGDGLVVDVGVLEDREGGDATEGRVALGGSARGEGGEAGGSGQESSLHRCVRRGGGNEGARVRRAPAAESR